MAVLTFNRQFDTLTHALTGAWGVGTTITVDYPAGGSASRYVGNRGHEATPLSTRTLSVADGTLAVAFGESSIALTNVGGPAVTSGTKVIVRLQRAGAQADDMEPAANSMARNRVFKVDLGAPVAADADGVAASQAATIAGGLGDGINGALAAGGVATMDVPRALVASWTGAAILTITGTDAHGAALTESMDTAGTSFTGKKAFKTVTGVSVSADVTGLTIGTGNVLGLPFFLHRTADVLAEIEDGAPASSGTLVAGDLAVSSTSGDVRGTYVPATTPNGSARFALTVSLGSAGAAGASSNVSLGISESPGAPPPGGDLGEVLASGWQLQPVAAATEDPPDPNGGSPETITIQRPGFDTSGNAATRTLTVTKMKRVRGVYPATTPGADPAIALSRDIYATDTIVGGTNSSTKAAPAAVPMWLTLDRTLHSTGGADLVVEASIWHASMCDGPGLATVRITDGTTTITATATTTETGTAYHNGLNPPRHRFTFADAALATLNEGECTMHLNYKPYWGPEWDSETDGQTYGVVGAGYTGMAPRKIILDHGTLGVAYAVVDVTNGTAGAGDFTSTTIKEARADAAALDGTANTYTGIAAAAQALQAYANANFGRNDAGCCYILLSANGSVLQEDFNSVVTSLGALNIEPVVFGTPVNYTTAITTSRTLPLHTIWRNVNWVIAANTHIPWNGPAGGAFRSYQWEGGSLSAPSGFNANAINIIGNWTAKNIDGTGLGNISTGSQATVATVIGCTDLQTGYGHRFFGNVTPNIQVNNALSDRPQPVGQIVAFNQLTSDTGEGITMAAGSGAAGMVVAGNVPEYVGSVPAVGAVVSLVVGAEEVQNAIVVGNSVPLEKANIFYSDGAGDSNEKRPTLYAGNIWYSPNHKGDHFATDGTSIGNWPMRFRVNCRKNIHTTGDDQNDGVGPTEWQGELLGLGEVFGSDGTPVSVPWTDNQTTGNGLGAGGGDYSLTGDTSAVPKWAIGERPYTHDLFGTAIANDGTAPIGAVQ